MNPVGQFDTEISVKTTTGFPDSYGILNLSVGYEVDNYSFEFFVRNAADKFYANNYTTGGLLGDQQYLNHDHERLIGLNFKYSFGE